MGLGGLTADYCMRVVQRSTADCLGVVCADKHGVCPYE